MNSTPSPLHFALGSELVFSNTLTHSSRRRNAASNSLDEIVGVIGAAPLLMSEDVAADLAFLALDQLHIRLHSLLGKRFCEQIANVCVGVKTTKLKSVISNGSYGASTSNSQ